MQDNTIDYTYATSSQDAGASAASLIFYLIFIVMMIVGLWKTFSKAGRPGWAAIVPVYNTYVMLKIAGKPGWWLLLLFVPIVNIVISFLAAVGVAKAFNRSTAFGIFMLGFLPFIGYLMLGFGGSQYGGAAPVASAPGVPAAAPQQPMAPVAPVGAPEPAAPSAAPQPGSVVPPAAPQAPAAPQPPADPASDQNKPQQ